MKIPDTPPFESQVCKIGRHEWSVARLVELSNTLPVIEAPIDAISVWIKYNVTLRELVGHIKSVLSADLSLPIILDEDGELMDGAHRLMKAILEGRNTIYIVRFDSNPQPCRILEN